MEKNSEIAEEQDFKLQEDNCLLSRKIFVGNISFRITREELAEFFSTYGTVVKAMVVKDHTRRRSRGIGFVTFSSVTEVNRVLSLDPKDLYLDNRLLRINRAEQSKLKTFKPARSIPLSDLDSKEHDGKVGDNNKEPSDSSDVQDDDDCSDVDLESHEDINSWLTDDCLSSVFLYLNVKERILIERVCKRWRGVVLKSWPAVRHLEFKNIFKQFRGITDKILRSIYERGCINITSLDLSGSARLLTEHALELTAHYCKDLTSVNLTGVTANNHTLKTLAQACPKLQRFCMKNSHYAGEKGLWWIFHLCPNLQEVNLDGNLRITGQCFHMFNDNLLDLRLNDCLQLQDVGIQKLLEKCTRLQRLDVKNCNHLGDQALKHISQGLQKLTVLDLSGTFPNMTSETMENISHLVSLTDLSLSQNSHVTDRVLELIAMCCTRLRRLDISGCYQGVTSAGIQSLQHCHSLTMLNISYIPKVDDRTLEMIGLHGNLEELKARACCSLSDSGVMKLVELCPNLRSLDLSGCEPISTRSLQGIISVTSRSQRSPRLLHLHFGGTSILSVDMTLPDYIKVDLYDLHNPHLRFDRELTFTAVWDEEEDDLLDDMNSLKLQADYGYSTTCSYDDGAEMFLEADDPMMEEELEWS